MFLLHGKRNARIKKVVVNDHCCTSCGSYETQVFVYREYYHLFFIPLAPVGDKTAFARCRVCSEPMRAQQSLNQYAGNTRTPFYLYTLPLLFLAVVLLAVFGNINGQAQKKEYVNNPKVGDVYLLRDDSDKDFVTFRFLKLTAINGDSVAVLHNHYQYFAFRSKLDSDDYFVKDQHEFFTKDQLKQLLEKDVINAVTREYGQEEGFHRIQ